MGIFSKIFNKNLNDSSIMCGGVVKDGRMEGYDENINSDNIVSFEYVCGSYSLKCKLENDKLHVMCSGGYSNQRDGKYFKVDFTTLDISILKDLNKIIKEHEISKNNGYVHETAGLPSGLGDTIDVLYDSDEKIYKSSNQSTNVSEEVGLEFYKLFHKLTKKNKLDFNSDGSNVLLYDDTTEDYLQGTWNGTHFGIRYKVVFDKNNVKIYVDDKLTDDCDYIIDDGWVKPNKLKDGVDTPLNHYSYEDFNACSSFNKKNQILLSIYMSKPGYSVGELLREDDVKQ